jgi:DnaJ family protein B protein 4
MGDQEPGRPADDLVFVVAEKPHPRFTRDGNDLHTSAKLSLLQALQGGGVQVCTRCLDVQSMRQGQRSTCGRWHRDGCLKDVV